MFDWLFEGRPSIYLLCATLAVIGFMLWFRRQRSKLLLSIPILALIAAAIYATLDVMVETGAEQIRGRTQAMAAAVGRKDLDAAFAHVSDQFRSPGGKSKGDFQELARGFRDRGYVTEVKVWEFDVAERPDPAAGRARVSFLVKVAGDAGRAQHLYARCEAVFDHHPTAGWRLRGFELFDPTHNNERMPFPY